MSDTEPDAAERAALGAALASSPEGREYVRGMVVAALDASIDHCARCKVCDNQVDAVMDVFVRSASIRALIRAAGKIAEQRARAEHAEATERERVAQVAEDLGAHYHGPDCDRTASFAAFLRGAKS